MSFSELTRKIFKKLRGGVVTLRAKGDVRGRVLLSYTTLPFISPQSIGGHTNRWECQRIAEIWSEYGYTVDIVDFDNLSFLPNPKKKYDYCIDIQNRLEDFAPYLPEKCVKIFHITTAHWKFNNEAEQKRIEEINKKRNASLSPSRGLPSSKNIELADAVTMLGNDFTESTYAFAGKKIFHIPISTTHLYDSPEKKDFEKARKSYVWIGGAGMAHKGLDLVLEAFVAMPEYNLVIFGKPEVGFVEAYHNELYKTANIHYVGNIDLGSRKFTDIANTSLSLIFPSCSEGQSGGVVTATHAGLIPVVSYQSGVDVADFGIILKENTVVEIEKEIRALSSLPAQTLREKAVKAWEYARAHHTRETFEEAYGKFVDKVTK